MSANAEPAYSPDLNPLNLYLWDQQILMSFLWWRTLVHSFPTPSVGKRENKLDESRNSVLLK